MIGIVDYDAGNIRSVENALDAIGVPCTIAGAAAPLEACDGIILPGVGAAPGAMRSLKEKQLDGFLRAYDRPLLGICLGMQILFKFSAEGSTPCLGLVEGSVGPLPPDRLTVPHMGWNVVRPTAPDPLWNGIAPETHFYFAHSFVSFGTAGAIAETECGVRFASAVRRGNVRGVQFHPEKSGNAGLRLLSNFASLCKSFRQ